MFLCKWRARKQTSLHRDIKVVLYCIVLYIRRSSENHGLSAEKNKNKQQQQQNSQQKEKATGRKPHTSPLVDQHCASSSQSRQVNVSPAGAVTAACTETQPIHTLHTVHTPQSTTTPSTHFSQSTHHTIHNLHTIHTIQKPHTSHNPYTTQFTQSTHFT